MVWFQRVGVRGPYLRSFRRASSLLMPAMFNPKGGIRAGAGWACTAGADEDEDEGAAGGYPRLSAYRAPWSYPRSP